MQTTKRILLTALLAAGGMCFMTGCQSTNRGTPWVGSDLNFDLKRDEYRVMKTVQGISTEDSYFFGFVRVIDDDPGKLAILGFKTFDDQYIQPHNPTLFDAINALIFGGSAGPVDRAYFKALAEVPDADFVVPRAYEMKTSGVRFIASRTTASVKGKALQLKPDAAN